MATGQIKLISDNAYMATHVFQEDSKTKHLERVVSTVGLAEIGSSANYTTTVTGTSNFFSCAGKGNILIKCLNTSQDGWVAIRGLMYDVNKRLISLTGVRESNTVSGIQDGSKYVMESFLMSNMAVGSSYYKIMVTSISGTVEFYTTAF